VIALDRSIGAVSLRERRSDVERELVHVGSSRAALRTITGLTCGNLLHLDCQHGGHVHNQPGTFFKLSGPGGRGIVVRIAIALSD
jgi:hypothetical protein